MYKKLIAFCLAFVLFLVPLQFTQAKNVKPVIKKTKNQSTVTRSVSAKVTAVISDEKGEGKGKGKGKGKKGDNE
ncbi:hypothetical protein MK805_14520 [Shimazuella sp. AN120528]|uniref:hypothetical protein n=1 Tax=Shimazuella soli TaxID=1892854 RepID=UPI001F0F9E18|nr:hypothetical protein [Shimazuella soli]MCH5586153.1 hypothetical protein [Shimazuella soli]